MTAITLYSLSTCSYCQAIRKMLTDLAVTHRAIEVDLLEGDEREAAVNNLRAVNPQCSFPTTVIGDRVVTGFKVQEIKETIGVRTEVDDLYDRLRALQEPKGYPFNRDRERTFDLLRGLLTNRAAPAGWPAATGSAIGTSSVPVSTGRRTCATMAPATVNCTCRRIGMKERSRRWRCRSGGRRTRPDPPGNKKGPSAVRTGPG